MLVHASGLLLVILLQSQPPPNFPSVAVGPPPACGVSEDADYGYKPEQPVQVGGSPMYGAARQRRYLDALRGPAGERVVYKRKGQSRAPDGTILDAYEVTYEGLAAPVTLLLDWYHYNPQLAPRGFTCGQPINLGVPPVDPFHESEAREKLAAAQGGSREFEPIPLGPGGSTTHGVIYDRFRLLARAVKTASKLPQSAGPHQSVIAAYPLACGDRAIPPAAIDIVAGNGAVFPKSSNVQLTEADVEGLLPGLRAPAGTIFAGLALTMPRANDTIRITYKGACGGASDQVNLRVSMSGPRGVSMPEPALPAGAPADLPVLLQVLVDLDGTMQYPTYVGGPAALAKAAIDAVGAWKSEPGRINGAPVAAGALVQVRFKKP